MASNGNDSLKNSNSEEDLIDLDLVLPFKLDSNWLIECNGNSAEFQDSFSKLHFSNPIIKDMVKSVYQSGKSKQVLHQLLYWNEKMTISCDNCAYLYRDSTSQNAMSQNRRQINHRHSVAVTSLTENLVSHNTSNNSLTDSLDSLTIDGNLADKNGNDLTLVAANLMTQSSITDYDREFCAPTESTALPMVKGVSASQNVLSRTYDKEDLEILKQTKLSQSVFVPHISGSKIDHYSEIEFVDKPSSTAVGNQRHTFARSEFGSASKSSYLKRLFPIATTLRMPSDCGRRPRPTSAYQVDKLTKSTIDRCVKMSQIKQSNLKTKHLLQMNENIFETDVMTPINSPRNVKHFFATNQQSRLRRPITARK